MQVELDVQRGKLREAACIDLGSELSTYAQEVVCRRIEASARHARELASLSLLRELELEANQEGGLNPNGVNQDGGDSAPSAAQAAGSIGGTNHSNVSPSLLPPCISRLLTHLLFPSRLRRRRQQLKRRLLRRSSASVKRRRERSRRRPRRSYSRRRGQRCKLLERLVRLILKLPWRGGGRSLRPWRLRGRWRPSGQRRRPH